MKIYSWNMLFRNKETDRAIEFIENSDFDIFCIQEVPEEFLPRLLALHCFSAYRCDVERLFAYGSVCNYVVTLSKHPITGQGDIPFPDYWELLPWRTRMFVRLMRPFHFSRVDKRGGLYTDIVVKGTSMRVFNLHLILAHPEWRLTELELAMTHRDPSRLTIVCGDFNTLERPHVLPLNWLLGGTLGDALFHRRERTTIEKKFVEYSLTNPLRHSVTHQLSRSQLDHILVSHTFTIKNAKVISDRVGSDHHPICVEVE